MVVRFKLSQRLDMLVLLALAGLLVLGGSSLVWMRSNLNLAEQRRIKDVVDTTTAVLDFFHKKELSGELTEEEAQEEAISLLRFTRFEQGKNYIFINDREGTVLLSPLRPETEGINMIGERTADGVLLWDALTATITDNEARLISYKWPRTEGAPPEQKYSWVRPYEPWGWAVGAGIYLTAVDEAFSMGLYWTIAIGILLLVVLYLSSWKVAQSVMLHVGGEPGDAASVMQRVADGDLKAGIDSAPQGSLMHSLGVMLGSLRAILNAWQVSMLGLDGRGTIINWGQSAESLFGWTDMQVIGRNADETLLSPGYRKTFQEGLAAFVESGSDIMMNKPLEMEARDVNGRTFPIEIVFTPRLNRKDFQFTAYITDISARKEAAESLITLSRAVEQSPVSILITDSSGKIHYVNPQFEKTTGYTQKDCAGSTTAFLKADENSPDLDSEMMAILMSRQIWHGEFHTKRKDGSDFWELAVISPVFNEQNDLIHYIIVKEDITERKAVMQSLTEARESAEQANRAKSEFLSSMSHELRTPMNAILGFAQMLEQDSELNSDQQDNVYEILKGGRHLLQLINEVLDLAKIEAGRIDLSLEPLRIDELVESCRDLVQPLAAARNLSLNLDVAPDNVVRGDRIRLKQALLNLLSNAVKYNREGGTITLTVEPAANQSLRISVIDTGSGISSENLRVLFQPFSRLKAEHTEIEGTGIGLSITRNLVELMGGVVGVESEIGKGSCFWIELPMEEFSLTDQMEETDAGRKTIVQHNSTVGYRVLCIDDNPVNLKLVAQMLGLRPNIHLLTTHTPGLGVDMARTYKPDLILLDINMPNLDGYEVLEILKTDSRLNEIPVIAITANAMPRDRERGKAAGFTEYLTKPLNLEKFLAAVDRNLNPGEEE